MNAGKEMDADKELKEARRHLAKLYSAFFAGAPVYAAMLDAEMEVVCIHLCVGMRQLHVKSGDTHA
jgi:hypothetical protein